MLKTDLLIGAVVTAAILFSVVGVVTYERAAGATEYDVVWTTKSHPLASPPTTRSGAQTFTIDFPVSLRNLTDATFSVTVQGSGPRLQPVNVRITVAPINASEETKTVTLPAGAMAATQEASFAVKVQDLPNATTATGASENDTLAQLDRDHGNEKGVGVWKFTFAITFGGNTNIAGNENYTITITGSAKTYAATIQPHTPDVNR